jgi:hypothetical protein
MCLDSTQAHIECDRVRFKEAHFIYQAIELELDDIKLDLDRTFTVISVRMAYG